MGKVVTGRRSVRALLAALMVGTMIAVVPAASGAASAGAAATDDLLISEYIEGTSFNKAIEIYNGTGAAVDLSQYTLSSYFNGSTTAGGTMTLSGTLADGDVYIVAHASADPAILAVADTTNSSVVNWNGDDAIVLRKGDAVVDSFGQVGVDPGTEWPGGGLDDTLVRKPAVCAGDTDPGNPFDASLEFDTHPVNTFSSLGAHSADCGGGSGITDLFLSEYVEGSSFNKALEIYNGTAAPIDLSQYTLSTYFNGSSTAGGTMTLSGTLAPGDVYVVAHASAATAILDVADVTNSQVANFNGDDTVVLRKGEAVVDSFGTIGVQPPGGEWPGGGLNDTLVRKPTVCGGDTDPLDPFDASVEWNVHPQDTFGFLGAHPAPDCDTPTNQPVVATCAPPLVVTAGGGGTAPLSATDADGVVVNIAVTAVDPQPAAGTISAIDVVPATQPGGTATATLSVSAAVPVGSYTVTVTATNNDTTPQTGTCSQSVTVSPPLGVTKIHAIQGTGETSPMAGQRVLIEGVVVGDYEGPAPAIRGFYVQEEDADRDADPLTSEGVFVFHGDEDLVDLGDVVRVTGVVAEFQGQTQINFPESLTVVAEGATVTPAPVTLPVPDLAALEAYEGMLVTFTQTLYVTEMFQLGRFGQVVASAGETLAQPTSVVEPGAPAVALQAANNRNRIIIDDHLNNQNPDPILFGRGGNPLSATNPLRGGDTVTGATGVLTYGWAGNAASPNNYRLRVVGDLSDTGAVPGGVVPNFAPANPRPAAAPVVGGDGKVAAFNVLNYFLTTDTSLPGACGPTGVVHQCRGAESALELQRQRVKLLEALSQIDADIVGLVELENTQGVEPLADIVAGLNDLSAPGTWAYINTGTIGTDAIKVGLIYKTASATPVGNHAILTQAVDPRFDDDRHRPVLAQTFDLNGEVLTVAVHHLKSKGCDEATGADADQGDGQSCWNAARVQAAQAVVSWLAGNPTGVDDPDHLVIGDLNSYAMEDPIDVFLAAGYTDLVRAFGGERVYSYVFDGQWGYLDYALSSASLTPKITGAADYHINADEASVLDFNTNFKSAGQIDSLFAPDEFRTSDHDPVIVGIAGDSCPMPEATATPNPAVLWPANSKIVPVDVAIDVTTATSDATVELVGVTSNEAIGAPRDITIIDDTHFRLRAARESRGEGRVYTITYRITDDCGTTEFTALVLVPVRFEG